MWWWDRSISPNVQRIKIWLMDSQKWVDFEWLIKKFDFSNISRFFFNYGWLKVIRREKLHLQDSIYAHYRIGRFFWFFASPPLKIWEGGGGLKFWQYFTIKFWNFSRSNFFILFAGCYSWAHLYQYRKWNKLKSLINEILEFQILQCPELLLTTVCPAPLHSFESDCKTFSKKIG